MHLDSAITLYAITHPFDRWWEGNNWYLLRLELIDNCGNRVNIIDSIDVRRTLILSVFRGKFLKLNYNPQTYNQNFIMKMPLTFHPYNMN